MQLDQNIIDFGIRELDKLAHRLEELQAEWAEATAQRNAWTVILGNAQAEPKAQGDGDVMPESEPKENMDGTALARKAISSTGESGFKPKDITLKVEGMGGALASGFASNLLFRMKKRGEVIEHNGRYYLPHFDPRQQRQNGNPITHQQQTPP